MYQRPVLSFLKAEGEADANDDAWPKEKSSESKVERCKSRTYLLVVEAKETMLEKDCNERSVCYSDTVKEDATDKEEG